MTERAGGGSAGRRTQAERTGSTRAALVAAGRDLFAARGFADVSAEEITAAAGVTRGALYHHYGGKEGLFRAVFEDLERGIAADIETAVAGIDDSRALIVVALATFLDLCERPEVVRLALTDAPAVLGWADWRAIEAAHGLGVVIRLMRQASERGELVAGPVEVLAQLALSAVIEAALLIAHADDREATRARAQQSLLTLFSGLLVQP